jgi:23S rRNA (guanine2445-N2)-methyltransferase / 23S rRNA (guanine2069-N7)-methyltransferase
MSITPPTNDFAFFATCPRNTEGLLLDELRSLGAADAAETRAGVAFHGPLSLAYRACLWSRVASRVLLRLHSCAVEGPDDLYECAGKLPWEDHLLVSGTLAVEVTTTISRGPLADLNTHFAEQRVKDAVVDRFRARVGTRPGVDLARPDIRINCHLTPEGATFGIDLSGGGLHRRGYRTEGGEAPLKENLAAAILLRAGWPRVAKAGGVLLDPMCGSGTLLIEGALMAADIAPGLLRDYYGFLHWKPFEPGPWEELLQEARDRRDAGMIRLPALYGFDADVRAVGTARNNVRKAGLAGRITVERRELALLAAPKRPGAGSPPGLVVTNPPYGKRLGEVTELVEVYETLGERLKASFSGWETAVFTGNPDLGAHLGLRAHRTNVFFNGPIECRLLQFRIGQVEASAGRRRLAAATEPGPDAEGREGTGAGADGDDVDGADAGDETAIGENSGAVMFENRLRKNLKHLRRWAAREDVHCYRLYDADLPEYSAAIDLYEDWAHVQEYAAPSTVDQVRARRRLKEMLAAVPKVLEIPPSHVVLKVRRQQRGTDQYQRLKEEGHFVEVREAGLRFLVNLTDYLDAGLFLDHRGTRGMIRDLAQTRRFLNLFAYTGSATVYAAAGGAATTTTVDLSLTYLDWARRNLELNRFMGANHSFVRADCLEWLNQAATGARGPAQYDLIFLDGPTFSNSKAMQSDLEIQRDHPALIWAAARLLSPDGILLFSTNFRHFKLEPALLHDFVVEDITKQTIPPDFVRNARIHTCFRFTWPEGGWQAARRGGPGEAASAPRDRRPAMDARRGGETRWRRDG